jgi:uncharacterized membrane protein
MLGLTNLGVVHTAVSLVAVATGFAAIVRYREITTKNRLGGIYLASTVVTAATGLGIFQHGGFGPPHVLSILTLAAVAGGFWFGSSRRLQAAFFTTTLFFHMIPGFTETLTRLPAGHPVFASQEDPGLRPIQATLAVLYVIGLTIQLRWLKRIGGK